MRAAPKPNLDGDRPGDPAPARGRTRCPLRRRRRSGRGACIVQAMLAPTRPFTRADALVAATLSITMAVAVVATGPGGAVARTGRVVAAAGLLALAARRRR